VDLNTITAIRTPGDRSELDLAALSASPATAVLGGGSWLFSEPQPHLDTLVDLTAMRWPAVTMTAEGMSLAATCTIAELAALEPITGWASHPLIRECCEALLGSFKVWNVATVGGNICLGLPAGPMTSLAASLDADAVIWTPDGRDRRMPVLDLVTGVQATALAPGEVLRSIEIPSAALRSRSGVRRIALSPLGRSGTLVIARVDDTGAFLLTITAATVRPVRIAFDGIPTSGELAAAVRGIDRWFDDVHGAPDWRAAMTARFAEQLREALA
jgi:CO/xanthine dehydrogenase FAD-binding subunit